ncbi:MAG: hypothetical protein ACFFDN_24510 [Candidatus Hodarchaeota archaeon]
MEKIKNWFSKMVEEELGDYEKLSADDRVISVAFVMFFPLIAMYFAAHQMFSTGFFTATFGVLGMVFLYGTLFYWIFTCAVLLLELKDLSRDVDSFGGLIFAAIGCAWLSIVFPFDFTYFAYVLPEGLRFLAQWISDGIARVGLVLAFIIHLVLAIIAGIQRVMVRKELAHRKK